MDTRGYRSHRLLVVPHRFLVAWAAVTVALLSGCSSDSPTGGGRESGIGATSATTIPRFDADCDEIEAANTRFGEEHVFRAQYDDIPTVNGKEPEDVPDGVRDSAVLLIRDAWSLCAFEIPQFAEDLAADSPLAIKSAVASVTRDNLTDQGIHVFDQATDAATQAVGERLCIAAKVLQPLSSAEIVRIANGLIDRYGRMTHEEAGKVFLIMVPAYCPNLDMSG
jgi:hypothetical protein